MRGAFVLFGFGFGSIACTGGTGPTGAMGDKGDPGGNGEVGSQGATGSYAPGAGTPGSANAVLTADGAGSATWSTSASLSPPPVTGTGKAGFGRTTAAAKVDGRTGDGRP